MPNRYFFGNSVKTSRVGASSARNFRELVQRHLEPAFKLNVTREHYLGLTTKADKLDAKDSPYLVACTFKELQTSRAIENANDCCNVLFLDLDEEKDGICPAAPFVNNPSSLARLLAPFSFAAFETASSTKAKPRMRIVIDAEGIPLADYPNAVRTIAKNMGLTNVTRESMVPNQPMICPSLFLDQDPDVEHPMVYSNVKGEPFTVAHIEEIDPSKPQKKAPNKASDDDDGLEYLRAQLEGMTLEATRPVLYALSPDVSYPEWFEICAALKHQFSFTPEEEEAYTMFDQWSAKGSKYVSQEDTRAKWNSAKPSPKGRIPVTIRTLIKRASDAGYSAGEVKEACFNSVMTYITETARTLYDFSTIALGKVAGLPLLTSVEEDMLLTAIRTTLREKRQETVTVIALRKDLKKLRDHRERKQDTEQKDEPAWSKGWCYVTSEEMFYKASTHQKLSAEALDSAFGRYLLPTEEQIIAAGREVTQAELNKPLYLPRNYLLHHKQCLIVEDYTYDPTNPKDIYIETPEGVKYVNTYRRSFPKADKTHADKAGALWNRHMENLIQEPEYRRIVTDYIAHIVQFTGRKIRWAPLIQGAEGCGKTFFAKMMSAIVGPENVNYVNNDAIRSTWNDWSYGSQIIIIGEIRVAGHNRHDVMNRLKDLVTDDRIAITQRNRSVRTVDNTTNYVMFTNFHDALALMSGSRRYFVVKSALQTEQQVKALGENYFNELFDMITENAAGLRYFFENHEISDDFPCDGRAPKTKYLDEVVEDSADELTATIRQLVYEGDHPLIQRDLISSSVLKAALEFEGIRETAPRIAKRLRDENYIRVEGKGTYINGTREHLWVKCGELVGLSPDQVREVAKQRHNKEPNTTENDTDSEDLC